MNIKLLRTFSLIAYTFTVLVVSLLFIFEPAGFDARSAILPLVSLLLLSSIGLGYELASKTESTPLKIAGTVAFAVLLTFVGFFVVAAVAWLSALSHAQ